MDAEAGTPRGRRMGPTVLSLRPPALEGRPCAPAAPPRRCVVALVGRLRCAAAAEPPPTPGSPAEEEGKAGVKPRQASCACSCACRSIVGGDLAVAGGGEALPPASPCAARSATSSSSRRSSPSSTRPAATRTRSGRRGPGRARLLRPSRYRSASHWWITCFARTAFLHSSRRRPRRRSRSRGTQRKHRSEVRGRPICSRRQQLQPRRELRLVGQQ